jgi:hypothetical protein
MNDVFAAERRRPSRWLGVVSLVLLVAACSRPPGGELQALLRKGDTVALEARLAQVDQAYESGQLSETELRHVYREFYVLDAPAAKALEQWLASAPSSYQAHLIQGIALKRQAWAVRGSGRADRLQPDQASDAARLFRQADEQLSAALALDERPLMAAFHLMDVLGQNCQRERLRSLLDQTREYNRYSAMVLNRYQWYLKPRWCGSYSEMTAFVEAERAGGMPAIGLLQLEAIEDDSRGQDWLDSRKPDSAAVHFKRALDKAKQIGGEFQAEWLVTADAQRCQLPQLKAYCE